MSNQQTPQPNVREWTIQADTEPSVRVGIILKQDAQKFIRIDIPDQPHHLIADGFRIGEFTKTKIGLTLTGGKLVVSAGDENVSAEKSVIIEPVEASTSADDAMVVHDIIAGRGFHWQKRCDQALAGSAEILANPAGLILINTLPLETYLAGVITAEMSGACPVEFLKAQCVVARSWLLALSESKHDADPFDRCNDDCCQRYQGIANTSGAAWRAVGESRGLVLLDDQDGVVDAVYSKNCGGISETPESVWGHSKPCVESIIDAVDSQPVAAFTPTTEQGFDTYLRAGEQLAPHVYCSPSFVPPEVHSKYLGHVDEPDNYYRWSVTQSREELEQGLSHRVSQLARLLKLVDLTVTNRGVSGRAQCVRIDWLDDQNQSHQTDITPEYNIRHALHPGFLYSSAFAVEKNQSESGELKSITLNGLGWGHGAGLCQMGALGMGLSGKQLTEILSHYFPSAKQVCAYK
ncbi:MAG TPA: SpoIID/LytB domain-containing protein [Phycisphaerae bacterium]|nr:SpoIID/LytB domain-containing protein [Phycisphaerae bacterium]